MKIKKVFIISLLSCFFITPVAVNGSQINNLSITAESAYLCDYNSGEVIFAKNENIRKPIASMTKIMTLLLAFERYENNSLLLTDKVLISDYASSMGGSQVFLQAKKEYIVEDLLKSIVVASANDASVAISEYLFGSEENAVVAMNQKAKDLGLMNTLFSNTTGLTRPTQYSSAKDVATMFRELLKHEIYYKFSSIYLDEIIHPDGKTTQLTNTNKLIKSYTGCDGGKTGFTNEAGYCVAATAKRGAMRIVGVIINEPDSKTRFADCSKLFNYAFENYDCKQILADNLPTEYNVEIKKGKKQYCEVYSEKPIYIFSAKNKKDEIKFEFVPLGEVIAPIKEGQQVGDLIVYLNGVKYCTTKAVVREKIDRKSLYDIMEEIVL